jgi:hypothetical protein
MPFAPLSTRGGAESLHASRILLVQGSASGSARIESLLCEAGFTNLVSTTDSRLALTSFLEVKPDLSCSIWPSRRRLFRRDGSTPTALPETRFCHHDTTASASEETKGALAARDIILAEPFDEKPSALAISKDGQAPLSWRGGGKRSVRFRQRTADKEKSAR